MGNLCFSTVVVLFYVLLSIELVQPGGCSEAMSNVSCKHGERKALLKFKESLVDKSHRLSSWTGNDCCTWEGVGCSKITNHVVKLDLHNQVPFDSLSYSDGKIYAAFYSNSCLGGELNPSLLELEHLQYLDLSMNNFSGIQIPAFFGSIKNLRYLDLSEAGFGGMIPDHLGNLSSLDYLHLGESPLGWSFGLGHRLRSKNLWWIANLSSLKGLDLSGVYLGEAIDWLHATNLLPALESLNLAGCHLDTIPLVSRLNFTSLTYLDLVGNGFNTSIPLWLSNLTSLTSLHLAGNYFHGPIPDFLVKLTSLTVLDLFSNSLSNSLPNSLCNLSSVSSLYLHYNHFDGSLPSCIGKLTSLKELNLNFNKISGSIPTSLGKLENLQRLELADNPLTDVLSELHFLNLKQLKVLRLSSNSLTWNVSFHWSPPFQLRYIDISSTEVGPQFPSWLQTQKEVETLIMSRANISDTIPDWFEIVYSQINYVDITYNLITGKLPKFKESTNEFNRGILLYSNKFEGSLDSFPSDAFVFDASKNFLTGDIPLLDGSKPMRNVRYLTLNENMLTGSIPNNLCNLQTLHFLDLSNNQLSGSVPSCLGNLRYLSVLNLGNNSLSGQIPSSLGNMELLILLKLNKNKFHGEIPPSWQYLKNLEVLDLGGNGLKGPIPVWIGYNLSNLRVLRLQSNKFSGEITLELCQLSNLQLLNLAANNLTGQIPRCFVNFSAMVSKDLFYRPFSFITARHPSKLSNFMKGRELEYSSNLPYIKSLGLSENNLVGEIPEELMKLEGLQSLNLSRNHLRERIPLDIGNLKQLESLDLSRNELSGSIPQSLSALNSLSFLNLSFNKLSGRIPTGNQLQTLDDPSIYVGNNGLCGRPLPNICSDPNEPSGNKGPAHKYVVEQKSTFLWFFAGLGPGFAVGFSAICSILVFKKQWRYAYFQFVDDVHNRLWTMMALKNQNLRQKFNS